MRIRSVVFIIAVTLLLFASNCFAQTQHFVISANAASTTPGAVSVMSSGFQVTNGSTPISLAYTRISNPSDGTKPIYNMGDLNVSKELAAFLPASLKAHLAFDPTNYQVTFQASGGKATAPTYNRIAVGAGIYLSRPVANNVQLTVGYRFLMPGNVLVKVPSAGLNFTF